MEDILSKRIILLTNALLLLCALGFIALIHRIDSSYKAGEYLTLNKLRNCVESIPKDADDPELLADFSQQWLEANKHALLDQKFKSAARITEIFEKNGFGSDVHGMKVRSSERISGFRMVEVKNEDTISCCDHGLGNLDGSHRLKHFVQQYRYLFKPVTIRVLTGFNDSDVVKYVLRNPKLQPFLPASPGLTSEHAAVMAGDDARAKLKKVALSGDSCLVSFELTEHMQIDPDALQSAFPVKASEARDISRMELLQIDPDYKKINDSRELKKLVETYGGTADG